jgi:hypothetical protein
MCERINPGGVPAMTRRNATMPFVLALLLVALAIAGCTSTVKSDVTRFHRNELPQGETIRVVAKDPARQGDIEFEHYAQMVRDKLREIGYTPVTGDQQAALTAQLDYSVSDKDTLVRSRPADFVVYHFAWGHYHDPYYFGFHHDWERETYTYTVYHRDLSLAILENGSEGRHRFEGRVHSVGREQEIAKVMPYLVTALFKNFPGESGVTKVVEIEREDHFH